MSKGGKAGYLQHLRYYVLQTGIDQTDVYHMSALTIAGVDN